MDLSKVMNNVCPFCGQFVMDIDGDDPRMHCDCEGAHKYKERLMHRDSLIRSVEKLFGDECAETDETFQAVPEEVRRIFAELCGHIAEQRIDSAAVVLGDGTKCKITPTAVERSRTHKVQKRMLRKK